MAEPVKFGPSSPWGAINRAVNRSRRKAAGAKPKGTGRKGTSGGKPGGS